MENQTITLQDPLLRPAATELENILQELMGKMIEGGYETGTASLRLKFEFENTDVVLPETGEMIKAKTPIISYKVTYGVKETIGVSGTTKNDRKIIRKNEDGEYIFLEAEKAQKSLF